MATKKADVCIECRNTDKTIWLADPRSKSGEEVRICEPCFNVLSTIGGGRTNIKGSQWRGEADVETVFWHDEAEIETDT